MTCAHEGPHWVLWNHTSGTDDLGRDMFIWQHVETALIHADEEYCADSIPVVRDLVDRAKKLAKAQPLEITDEELAYIRDAVSDGCEYMLINRYDEQEDWEAGDNVEDWAACNSLHGGGWAFHCWRENWPKNEDGTERDWQLQLPASEALALGYQGGK